MAGLSAAGAVYDVARRTHGMGSLQSAAIAAKGRTWSVAACKGFVRDQPPGGDAGDQRPPPARGLLFVARYVTRNRRYRVRVRFGRWFLGCATPRWRAA